MIKIKADSTKHERTRKRKKEKILGIRWIERERVSDLSPTSLYIREMRSSSSSDIFTASHSILLTSAKQTHKQNQTQTDQRDIHRNSETERNQTFGTRSLGFTLSPSSFIHFFRLVWTKHQLIWRHETQRERERIKISRNKKKWFPHEGKD